MSEAASPQSARFASVLDASALAGGAGLASAGAASGAPVAASPGAASAASASAPVASSGTASAGTASPASAGAAAPKRSSPLPLLLGGGAVLVVGVLGLALFSGHHPPAATNASANSAVVSQPASAVPAPAPADPLVTAAQAMVGDWGGNGAVCGSDPLTVAFDASSRTIRETLSNTPSVGALVGLRPDGSVELRFDSDGHTEYDSVSGDTLTLVFPTGSMRYQRCNS
jgi:hypothetical protein